METEGSLKHFISCQPHEWISEPQGEAVLTKRDQVPVVLQHHGPVGRIQFPPLLWCKVHGHILECHGFLRHKQTLFRVLWTVL